MALPPIISNSPLFKLFKDNTPANGQTNTEQAKAQALKDTVDISNAAARGQKVSGASLIGSDDEARNIARQAHEQLSGNDSTLGLDSEFNA